MTNPEYKYIEFCSSPKTLWGKIASRRWDWLGVDARGNYVLGNPRRTGVVRMYASLSTGDRGSVPGVHTVVVYTPDNGRGGVHDCHDEAAAVAEFEATLIRLGEMEGPQLFMVRRFEYGEVRDEDYVVTRPPTVR